ncbi:tRNA pseudouridine(38-40) synthase TruA [Nocardioides mangrovicus]|uniref:tRNA pseudouridine synthase A n=1 Tax=Nocardioides mangrovicus TaxID=2478913 RepID=A0A3L8P626_9ACTN|nr:tRNA pseudouridine(38-40) synthase TruA [Nocardioides mangrovicus]RLV50661.1 tRNA pseudouridine(38-40) synthase TruA [Nocardioides mangrovicus]
MRLRIDLSYDGAAFHGWAAQPGLRTVQGDLEAALDTVLRTTGTQLTVAGRTDSGVHARGQVAHVDVDQHDDRLARRLNGVLAHDVRVRSVSEAPEGFDARFSALWRRYAYRIADTAEAMDPLRRGEVVAWPRLLDVDAMNRAAAALLGEHDFAAFCKRREGATTIRTLLDLAWERDASGVLVGTVRADAFCHSMVRALVGCLAAVGEGRRDAGWAGEVLAGQRRDPGVTVMPAHGLTLEEVGYPPDDDLADQASRARVVRTLGSTP